jgi:hypothetical protein
MFGVSSDALAIVLTIIGVTTVIDIPIIFQMRSQTNNMNTMNNFLTRTALSQVDEKVAILYSYANNVKNWANDIQLCNDCVGMEKKGQRVNDFENSVRC